ncbi:hypothetical protein GCM10010977_11770 [Citricoccus zhacaiensis]|uniref:Uncharacterized protein n=1 Tax=Citricoccus zhacaiensis TaxID=489142 RepID=A0ABQ2LV60_9MICC|nr:hypothetical protein [Citricoccus zhacaiensis]GGO43496.1 hypothetical protein GCM10010977_11770 [Citricoccus zhacaiensis]
MDHVNPEVPEEDRLDEQQPQLSGDEALAEPPVADDPIETAAHRHDEELAEEWGNESFPASDPPSNY